jgi:hypothetical protein
MKSLVLASALLIYVGVLAVNCQDDLGAQVMQAVSLFPSAPQAARKQLRELGPSAFPYVLQMIRDDGGLGTIKKTFLIDVIARSRTEQSASALIELLTDRDPYVRGLAVSYLGKRKYGAAIPHLVKLLDDKGVFVTRVRTDPDREDPVLVRDKAIEALQAITGKAMDARATQDEQAKAWVRWWEKRQRSN